MSYSGEGFPVSMNTGSDVRVQNVGANNVEILPNKKSKNIFQKILGVGKPKQASKNTDVSHEKSSSSLSINEAASSSEATGRRPASRQGSWRGFLRGKAQLRSSLGSDACVAGSPSKEDKQKYRLSDNTGMMSANFSTSTQSLGQSQKGTEPQIENSKINRQMSSSAMDLRTEGMSQDGAYSSIGKGSKFKISQKTPTHSVKLKSSVKPDGSQSKGKSISGFLQNFKTQTQDTKPSNDSKFEGESSYKQIQNSSNFLTQQDQQRKQAEIINSVMSKSLTVEYNSPDIFSTDNLRVVEGAERGPKNSPLYPEEKTNSSEAMDTIRSTSSGFHESSVSLMDSPNSTMTASQSRELIKRSQSNVSSDDVISVGSADVSCDSIHSSERSTDTVLTSRVVDGHLPPEDRITVMPPMAPRRKKKRMAPEPPKDAVKAVRSSHANQTRPCVFFAPPPPVTPPPGDDSSRDDVRERLMSTAYYDYYGEEEPQGLDTNQSLKDFGSQVKVKRQISAESDISLCSTDSRIRNDSIQSFNDGNISREASQISSEISRLSNFSPSTERSFSCYPVESSNPSPGSFHHRNMSDSALINPLVIKTWENLRKDLDLKANYMTNLPDFDNVFSNETNLYKELHSKPDVVQDETSGVLNEVSMIKSLQPNNEMVLTKQNSSKSSVDDMPIIYDNVDKSQSEIRLSESSEIENRNLMTESIPQITSSHQQTVTSSHQQTVTSSHQQTVTSSVPVHSPSDQLDSSIQASKIPESQNQYSEENYADNSISEPVMSNESITALIESLENTIEPKTISRSNSSTTALPSTSVLSSSPSPVVTSLRQLRSKKKSSSGISPPKVTPKVTPEFSEQSIFNYTENSVSTYRTVSSRSNPSGNVIQESVDSFVTASEGRSVGSDTGMTKSLSNISLEENVFVDTRDNVISIRSAEYTTLQHSVSYTDDEIKTSAVLDNTMEEIESMDVVYIASEDCVTDYIDVKADSMLSISKDRNEYIIDSSKSYLDTSREKIEKYNNDDINSIIEDLEAQVDYSKNEMITSKHEEQQYLDVSEKFSDLERDILHVNSETLLDYKSVYFEPSLNKENSDSVSDQKDRTNAAISKNEEILLPNLQEDLVAFAAEPDKILIDSESSNTLVTLLPYNDNKKDAGYVKIYRGATLDRGYAGSVGDKFKDTNNFSDSPSIDNRTIFNLDSNENDTNTEIIKLKKSAESKSKNKSTSDSKVVVSSEPVREIMSEWNEQSELIESTNKSVDTRLVEMNAEVDAKHQMTKDELEWELNRPSSKSARTQNLAKMFEGNATNIVELEAQPRSVATKKVGNVKPNANIQIQPNLSNNSTNSSLVNANHQDIMQQQKNQFQEKNTKNTIQQGYANTEFTTTQPDRIIKENLKLTRSSSSEKGNSQNTQRVSNKKDALYISTVFVDNEIKENLVQSKQISVEKLPNRNETRDLMMKDPNQVQVQVLPDENFSRPPSQAHQNFGSLSQIGSEIPYDGSNRIINQEAKPVNQLTRRKSETSRTSKNQSSSEASKNLSAEVDINSNLYSSKILVKDEKVVSKNSSVSRTKGTMPLSKGNSSQGQKNSEGMGMKVQPDLKYSEYQPSNSNAHNLRKDDTKHGRDQNKTFYGSSGSGAKAEFNSERYVSSIDIRADDSFTKNDIQIPHSKKVLKATKSFDAKPEERYFQTSEFTKTITASTEEIPYRIQSSVAKERNKSVIQLGNMKESQVRVENNASANAVRNIPVEVIKSRENEKSHRIKDGEQVREKVKESSFSNRKPEDIFIMKTDENSIYTKSENPSKLLSNEARAGEIKVNTHAHMQDSNSHLGNRSKIPQDNQTISSYDKNKNESSARVSHNSSSVANSNQKQSQYVQNIILDAQDNENQNRQNHENQNRQNHAPVMSNSVRVDRTDTSKISPSLQTKGTTYSNNSSLQMKDSNYSGNPASALRHKVVRAGKVNWISSSMESILDQDQPSRRSTNPARAQGDAKFSAPVLNKSAHSSFKPSSKVTSAPNSFMYVENTKNESANMPPAGNFSIQYSHKPNANSTQLASRGISTREIQTSQQRPEDSRTARNYPDQRFPPNSSLSNINSKVQVSSSRVPETSAPTHINESHFSQTSATISSGNRNFSNTSQMRRSKSISEAPKSVNIISIEDETDGKLCAELLSARAGLRPSRGAGNISDSSGKGKMLLSFGADGLQSMI